MRDRRHGINKRLEYQGRTFTVTVNFSDSLGPGTEPIEVFYSDGMKSGSDLLHAAQDACIVISLALQAGLCPADLGKSLSGSSIIASIVEAVAEETHA